MKRSTAVFGLLAFLFYVACAAPGLETEDTAEFATGAKLLAMVHPPGYPLYLLAGHPFTALSDEPGYGLVLFSALCGALAVAAMHALTLRRLNETAAACAALSLCFSRGLWNAATGIEVYALTTLLLTLLLGALLEFRHAPSARKLVLTGLLTGLTMSHHMGLLILLPVLLPFLLLHGRHLPVRAWCGAGAAWLLGLAPYLALLALSHRPDPPVIWWPPIRTAGELLTVMSGGPFKKLLFAVPFDQAISNLTTFPIVLFASFPLVGMLAALAGLFIALRDDRPVFYLLGGIIVITIVHAANYDVLDPEVFLTPALPAIALLAGFGFDGLARRFNATRDTRLAALTALVIIALVGRFIEGGILAKRFNTLPIDVGRAVLAGHEDPGAEPSLIWTDWRYYPVLKYFQLVEGRGAGAIIELDTTSETPGPTWMPGRTWAMRPTFTLGESYALVMSDLHWKVETGIPAGSILSPDSYRESAPLIAVGGIEILAATWPAANEVGQPIPVDLILRRTSGAAADTVLGEIVLLWEGRRRLSTPFAPLHWHLMPPAMPIGAVYREPIETIIPTAHRRDVEAERFEIAVRLQTATEDTHAVLGRIDLRP